VNGFLDSPVVTVSYFPGEFKCPAIGGFALTVKAEDYPVKVRALTNLIIIYAGKLVRKF
jgi:hypothetical protein